MPNTENVAPWQRYREGRSQIDSGNGREWLGKYGWSEGNTEMLRMIRPVPCGKQEHHPEQVREMERRVRELIFGRNHPGNVKGGEAKTNFFDLSLEGRNIGFGVEGYDYHPDADGIWQLRHIAHGRVSFPQFHTAEPTQPFGFVSATTLNPNTHQPEFRPIGLIIPHFNSQYDQTVSLAVRHAFYEANRVHSPIQTIPMGGPRRLA